MWFVSITKRIFFALTYTSLLTCVLPSCRIAQKQAATQSMWRVLYQNDTSGKRASGSKEDLVKAMKRGSAIKVSWGVQLENGQICIEFADPVFTTVTQDGIIIQYPMNFIQTSYLDPSRASLRLPPMAWRGMMSTDGRFDAFMYDLESGKVVRTLSQRANMTWYAFCPDPAFDKRPIPDLAQPNGIFVDSSGAYSRKELSGSPADK